MNDENTLRKQIVASDVFKALNLLIDRKAGELKVHMGSIGQKSRPSGEGDGIDTRVSHEGGGGVGLPMSIHTVKEIGGHVEAATKLHAEIRELQRYKLELLNDYDFTHGNASVQKAVFGDAAPQAISRG